MLVLSRKAGEKVQIGNNVTLVVLGISGNTIRLGFEAPAEVAIHRGEVHDRIAREVITVAMPQVLEGLPVAG